MRLTRRIVAIAAAVTCALALAACGKAVVAHVKASDTVHSALTSVLNAPTTQFVVTAQDLPGQAALADGNFSVVVTASHLAGGAADSMAGKALDVSIDYESNALVDLRAIGGSMYCRMDLKSIEGLAGSAAIASESQALDQYASRPGFGFLHDLVLGNWVGVSTDTLKTLEQQLAPQVPGAVSSISGVQNASGLGLQITNSWEQSVRTWLSIHQTSSNEYAVKLPLRSFAGSLVQELAKPLASYANELSPSQFSQAIDKIPADLSLHANLWVEKGAATKVQFLIPNSAGSLFVAISHPATTVQAPSGATMVTASDLTSIFASIAGPLSKAFSSSKLRTL